MVQRADDVRQLLRRCVLVSSDVEHGESIQSEPCHLDWRQTSTTFIPFGGLPLALRICGHVPDRVLVSQLCQVDDA